MAQRIKILLTGGGSGGHVYPLIAVAHALGKIAGEEQRELALWYMGPNDRFASLLTAENIPQKTVASAKLRRYFSLANAVDAPKFVLGFLQALFKMFWIMPDVVFSKGGPGALAVVLAARFYKIPIIIHESDSVPSLTTAVTSRFAERIGVSFASTAKYFPSEKVFESGNPIREELVANIPNQGQAKKEFGFPEDAPLILFLGGSQGAKAINDFVVANLQAFAGVAHILHQTGENNYDAVKKMADAVIAAMPPTRRMTYIALPYFEKNMQSALAAADLVVSRAGASALFEISAFGKPAILVPLPGAANDHQKENAREFVRCGGGKIVEERNLLPHVFLVLLREIVNDQAMLTKMSAGSKQFFKPGAAKAIAQEIFRATTRQK